MTKPIQGTQGGDILSGTAGNDKLLGHQGDDTFDLTNSTGSDTVDGQGGADTALFAGRFEDYLIGFKDTGNLKTTVNGHGLEADLKNVETLIFDNATYDVATHTALITTVSVSNAAAVSEGDPNLTFTFSRTGDLSHSLDVNYTLDGTATAGTDYAAPAAYTVHFGAGNNTATVSLAVMDDAIFEGSETVNIHLVADSHYNMGAQVNASGTILDNDPAPNPSPLLHISNASALEGGNLVFHVSVDAPTDHDITFQAFTDTGTHLANPSATTATNFGNATPGNVPGGDYDGFTPTPYTIHAGETSVDVSVHTRVDFVNEGNETMSLRLQNASGATITPGVGTGRGVGTITDDPVTKVSFYADPNNVTEGNDLSFHFHRDISSSALDVHYWMGTFGAGGATPGTDFTADGVNFAFVPGISGNPDFEAGQDHWADPSMKVHFDIGQTDATLVLHTTIDGQVETFGEAFTVQFDFAANGNHVQYDGLASQQDYLLHGGTNPTQVNIGHIADGFLLPA